MEKENWDASGQYNTLPVHFLFLGMCFVRPGHFLLRGLLPYAHGLRLDIFSFPLKGLRIFPAIFAQQGERLFEFVVH